MLAHIDVVEALPTDWSPDLNPFECLERDEFYYGRGVTDDKDEAAIHVANFIRMREEGFVPDRDIIVALTADEEGGPRNGVGYLIEEHFDLIDAAFTLNEGGGGMEQNGRKISNNVQLSEKKFVSFTFTATNPGRHSSLPVYTAFPACSGTWTTCALTDRTSGSRSRASTRGWSSCIDW